MRKYAGFAGRAGLKADWKARWLELSSVVVVAVVLIICTGHIWTAPLIDMRFNYRPENPLYLLIVRAYRLHTPTKIPNTPAYAGCKSWVPLDAAIDTGGATSVLEDASYAQRRQRILDTLAAART